MASHFFRYLDTVGDGTGTMNANGDYSATAQDFFFQPAFGVYVFRMIIMIEDTNGMRAEEYGNLGVALNNGYTIMKKDSDDIVQLDINDSVSIKTNAEIGRSGFETDIKSWGAGDEVLLAGCKFADTGAPLELDRNDKLVVTLNDDFTGLIEHFFMVQGIAD